MEAMLLKYWYDGLIIETCIYTEQKGSMYLEIWLPDENRREDDIREDWSS